jgi:hypothetical protein
MRRATTRTGRPHEWHGANQAGSLPDGRFEVRYDKAERQRFVAANDDEAESALRATAHLRGYARLHDADRWIFAAVYPYLRENMGGEAGEEATP